MVELDFFYFGGVVRPRRVYRKLGKESQNFFNMVKVSFCE